VVDEPPMGSDVYPDKPEDGAGVQNQNGDFLRDMVIYLGKFHHDLTVLPNPGIMVYFREIIPKYGLNSG